MRRFAVAFAFAAFIVFIGTTAWRAEAAPWAGAKQIAATKLTTNDIQKAACRGRGEHCPPGYVWNGNRCRPC
jgi:hypothetical protein